jgi:S-adenosylmethionine-diacylglycerol 3-amino-3-carboxypropyl transferase
MPNEFTKDVRLDVIRYSQVWEDHLLVEHGLAIRPDDDVLTIGSAGCNALAMALAGARRVLAVDVSPAQVALIKLKLAAIQILDPDQLAVLFGARPAREDGPDRRALYELSRHLLPDGARAFWDRHVDDIEAGILGCGRLERYIAGFRRHLDPVLALRLLCACDPAAQASAWRALATPELEAAFRAYFDRDTMAAHGRDPSQFAYVDRDRVDVAGHFWQRFRFAATELPAKGSFYLESFLTGRFRDLDSGPLWLRPGLHARLRAAAARVSVVQGSVEDVLAQVGPGTFSKANLSDVFEYASVEATDDLFERLARGVRRGGRLCYWNLLVPRESPARLRPTLTPQPELSRSLWRRDRSWFYRSFHVEDVT